MRPSTCSSARTAARWPATAAACWSASATSTWRARSSGSAASARARGSCSCSAATANDPLILQAKEAQASVLEPYLGKSAFNNHGQRVVEGQRLMQAESDILLGWLRTRGPRRRRPGLLLPPAVGRQGLGAWSRSWSRPSWPGTRALCGWTLAKAHARSGDAIAIAAYLGTSDSFDKALADVRRVVRGPERARLRGAEGRGRRRPRRGPDRALARSRHKRRRRPFGRRRTRSGTRTTPSRPRT